jgi:hypothetical protein
MNNYTALLPDKKMYKIVFVGKQINSIVPFRAVIQTTTFASACRLPCPKG